MQRFCDGDGITEFVWPVPAYKGECMGVCSVPTDVSVEEALRLLREYCRTEQ